MRYGFTGTRTVTDEHAIAEWLYAITQNGTEFTTGACVGFDALAANFLLEKFPQAIHRLVVPAKRAQVDYAVLDRFIYSSIPGWIEIEFMPNTTDYRARNARILDYTDELLVCAEYHEDHEKSKRSGTWMTTRIARQRRLDGQALSIRNPLILNPE